MLVLSLHRRLALSGALVAALTLAGAAAAGAPPRSTHASSTAVTNVAGSPAADSGSSDESDQNDTDSDTGTGSGPDAGNTVSTAAQSTLTGGAHDNHGGYVSCVARGGSNCTSSNPTLPTHGKPSNPGSQGASH